MKRPAVLACFFLLSQSVSAIELQLQTATRDETTLSTSDSLQVMGLGILHDFGNGMNAGASYQQGKGESSGTDEKALAFKLGYRESFGDGFQAGLGLSTGYSPLHQSTDVPGGRFDLHGHSVFVSQAIELSWALKKLRLSLGYEYFLSRYSVTNQYNYTPNSTGLDHIVYNPFGDPEAPWDTKGRNNFAQTFLTVSVDL